MKNSAILGFEHSELPRPIFQIRPRMYVRRTIQWERVAKAEWYFQTNLATKTFENSVIHIKSTSSTLI